MFWKGWLWKKGRKKGKKKEGYTILKPSKMVELKKKCIEEGFWRVHDGLKKSKI